MIPQVYEVYPLLCESGSKFEVILVIDARHQVRLRCTQAPRTSAASHFPGTGWGRLRRLRRLLLLIRPEHARDGQPLSEIPYRQSWLLTESAKSPTLNPCFRRTPPKTYPPGALPPSLGMAEERLEWSY